jgi:hypothetical protein
MGICSSSEANVKLWLVSLLLLCGCADKSLSRLAAQSAQKALTQLTTPWGEVGPPANGLSTTAGDLQTQLLTASLSLLALWRVQPHDPAVDPETQTIIVTAQPYQVQLDGDSPAELSFLLQTYSGELFVLLFSQTEDGAWSPLDAYRLPSLARKSSCRASSDGVIRFKDIQTTRNAPAFLWIEVQASNQCAQLQSVERTLHLLALQRGLLRPTLEVTLLRQSKNQKRQSVGEQLSYQAKPEPKQNTLLISGVRRIFPVEGGETGQEDQLLQWYYFDGTRYQVQR